MNQSDNREHAKRLASELIALCDALGSPIAACHAQHAADLLRDPQPSRLREEPSPWGPLKGFPGPSD